jgi:hypothetical protein
MKMALGFQDNPGNILGADTSNNQFASTNVASNADGSIIERIEYLQSTQSTSMAITERCIEKSDGAVLSGADALFTITGGPILVTSIIGIVTTVIGGAANGTLQATTTEPAATVALSTTVAIDNDAAGTSYRFVGATGVLTPDTNGAKIIDPVTVEDCHFLVPIGNINFLGSAARTGNIKWYMTYKPLSPSSVVVAAA